jgi:hypothetical protein
MMTHIDDWLDAHQANPPTDDGVRFAVGWLEHFRRPAIEKDYKWLSANPLFCTYKGNRYRCIGASRLGDVWLTSRFQDDNGYELRIDVADCSEWSATITNEGEKR